MAISDDEQHLRLLSIFHYVLAGMMMPFGTVLGVFTIIVLQRPSVRQLFGEDGGRTNV
jgi:hypothetical protein